MINRKAKIIILSLFVLGRLNIVFADETYNYDIKFGGKKIGYHSVRFDYSEKGFTTEAVTYYKIKSAGVAKELSLEEKGIYSAQGEPRIYTLNISINDSTSTLKLTVYGDTATIEFNLGEKILTEKVKIKRPAYILDRYMFNHYTILFRFVDFQKVKPGAEFDVIVPQLRKISKLKLEYVKRDTLERREVYKVSGLVDNVPFVLFIDAAMKNLVRLELQSENMLVMTTETPEEFPEENLNVADLSLGKLFLKSSKVLKEPNRINYLRAKAELEFSTIGDAKNYINNKYQSFDGVENTGLSYGEFKIQTPAKAIVDSVPFPYDYRKKVEGVYLSSDFMIPADDSTIIETALRVSAGKKTVWDVVKAFNRFVKDSIKYYPGSENATETLKSRRGNTLSKVLLHMALCRSLGIPSRLVGGLVYFDGLFVEHNWDEVYISENSGWVPVDPVLGEDDFFTATHISLWLGYGAINPSEKGGTVDIIEYKHKK